MKIIVRALALALALGLAAGAFAADKKATDVKPAASSERIKPTKEDKILFDKSSESWKNSSFLDHLHQKQGIGCKECHGSAKPVKGDTVENKTCVACHGDYPALAAKSKLPPKLANRNPHASHLGDIDCVVCHKSHKASEPYCLGCHAKFDMKMPGGK
jgi:hypothetical protein